MRSVNLFSALRRGWLLVVASTLLGVTGALAYTQVVTPQYASTAELFASAGNDGSAGAAYQGGLFVQQRVESYTRVVTSPTVLEPVIEELGLDESPRELSLRIDATSPADTVLIQIRVAGVDPDETAEIGNAVAAEFADYVEQLESRSGSVDIPVKMTVVRPAEVAAAPFVPKRRLSLLLGALAGFAVGMGLALLRETLDRSVRSGEEAEAVVGEPVVGSVPILPPAKHEDALSAIRGSGAAAEAYRGLRTNIQYVDVDSPVKRLAITSASLAEGKSTSSLGLALMLAEAGQLVLLLEADLRRPTIAGRLQLVEGAGLTSVLVGRASLHEVIQPLPGPSRLDVLPAGPIPPNPSEMLASQQMRKLIDEAAAEYDMVVIDTPPVLPVTDATVIAGLVDSVFLVCRYGVTRTDRLAESTRRLRTVEAPLRGIVMNAVPLRGSERHEYRYRGAGDTHVLLADSGAKHAASSDRDGEPGEHG